MFENVNDFATLSCFDANIKYNIFEIYLTI